MAFAVCSRCSFAGVSRFHCPETARLKKLQAATEGHSLQFGVDGSFSFMGDLPDSYTIFS